MRRPDRGGSARAVRSHGRDRRGDRRADGEHRRAGAPRRRRRAARAGARARRRRRSTRSRCRARAGSAALDALRPHLRAALERSAENIERVHRAFRPVAQETESEPGVIVGRRPDPLGRVGVYAPGGRAAYPSSVLMGIVPARVAGVGEIVLCSPPSRETRRCLERRARRGGAGRSRPRLRARRRGRDRGDGVRHGERAARRSHRRAGQRVRRRSEAAGRERGGDRFARRPERAARAVRRFGGSRRSSRARCWRRPSTIRSPRSSP